MIWMNTVSETGLLKCPLVVGVHIVKLKISFKKRIRRKVSETSVSSICIKMNKANDRSTPHLEELLTSNCHIISINYIEINGTKIYQIINKVVFSS